MLTFVCFSALGISTVSNEISKDQISCTQKRYRCVFVNAQAHQISILWFRGAFLGIYSTDICNLMLNPLGKKNSNKITRAY